MQYRQYVIRQITKTKWQHIRCILIALVKAFVRLNSRYLRGLCRLIPVLALYEHEQQEQEHLYCTAKRSIVRELFVPFCFKERAHIGQVFHAQSYFKFE